MKITLARFRAGAFVILLMMFAVMMVSPPVANATITLTGNDAEFTNPNSTATIATDDAMKTMGDNANADLKVLTCNGADGFLYEATATFSAWGGLGLENTSSGKTDAVDNGQKSGIFSITQTESLIEVASAPANQKSGKEADGEMVLMSMTVATGTYFLSSSIVNIRRSGEMISAKMEGVTELSVGAVLKKPTADSVEFSIDGAAITRATRAPASTHPTRMSFMERMPTLITTMSPIKPAEYRVYRVCT